MNDDAGGVARADQPRLDEGFVGISEQVADLPPEDLVELLNQLKLINLDGGDDAARGASR